MSTLPSTSLNIGVVFNPRSGTRSARSIHESVLESLNAQGHRPLSVVASVDERVETIVGRIVSQLDALVSIGGDGTLNGVVNGVLSSPCPDVPIGFVPAGRGCDASRSFEPLNMESIRSLTVDSLQTSRMDVIRATELKTGNFRFVVNIVDAGLGAEAARVAGNLPRTLGTSSYILGAAMALITQRSTTATVTIDGDDALELNGTLAVVVCNGRAFGGGVYIAPEANPNDGILTVVAVRNANLLDLGRNLGKLKSGQPFDHPALTRWPARSVVVESAALAPVETDGDMWGELPMRFDVCPDAINWITTS